MLPDSADVGGKILVLPNGTLLALFARTTLHPDFTATDTLFASRSVDQGQNWSVPVAVTSQATSRFQDEAGTELSNVDMFGTSAAVAPDGTVYAAWDHNTSPTSGTIEIVKSRDGGLTWSGPTPLPSVGAFAFEPALAITSRGIIGILWYDHRTDRLGDAELTTDVWFAHSDDGGGRWRQTHVAGPFRWHRAGLERRQSQGVALRGPEPRRGGDGRPTGGGPSDIFFSPDGPCRSRGHHGSVEP